MVRIKGWSGYFELERNTRFLNIAIGCGLCSKKFQRFECINHIKNV
ncbi:CRISPR-associated endoribonuclease Cas6 [Maledivibacter halophilus]